MFKIVIDDKALAANLSDLEKKQLPFATMNALNDAMFDVRDGWKKAMGTIFDSPTQLTLNAVLYKKATKEKLVAEVFLQDYASKGTAPSRYLISEVQGGARQEKPFEYLLRQAGIISADEFVVPARGFPLDAHGNVPGSVVSAILSDLGGQRDTAANSTPESKGKRARRKAIGKRAVYFESAPALSASQGRKQHLPRAIFQRTKFSSGSAIRMVFFIVKGAPRYGVRFNAEELARKLFNESFPGKFQKRLREAVASARIK